MLEYGLTVLNQIITMFLLMMVGFALAKLRLINKDGTAQISSILMSIIMPSTVLSAFERTYERALAVQLLQALVLTVIVYAVPALAARIFYKTQPDKALCLVFSNNGFMAIPLIQALLGSTGVFLGSAHIVGANIMTWTYGVSKYRAGGQESQKKLWRTLLFNPGTLALLGGLVLFLTPGALPAPLLNAVNHLAAMNTPLAMLLLGTYLADIKLRESLRDKSLLLLSALKLIVLPLILIGIFWLLPFSPLVRCAMLIGSAAPTGIVVSMLAQYCKRDNRWNTTVVTFTTLCSIITMPVILVLMNAVLG